MNSSIQLRSRAPACFSIGQPEGMAKQHPLWGKGPIVRYWAERGLVHWEDAKEGGYGSMSWQDAAKRVLALSQMVHNTRKKGLMGDEVDLMQKFVSDMEPIIRKAKSQGGPLDDTYQVSQERRRRSKKIMPMPSSFDPMQFKKARPARKDPHKGIQRKSVPKSKPSLILP